ncbi:MAG TPA: AraC family transcriptional regulator [Gemmatimonadales bacterium]|jgi:AraC-like DNA-binding protein|nr:AraC family transcriptional regulator [Gemmatimonadales bacterium]
MDTLSDLLRVVRLDGAFFYAVEAAEPWGVEAVAAKELTPRIMPSTEHLISYHILTEGRCYGGLIGEDQVEMVAGDVIVFPHGDAHIMSSEPGVSVGGPDIGRTAPSRYPFKVFHGNPGPRNAAFLCGFLGCDRRPFNPLLAALPRRMHMRGMSNAWLGSFVHQVTEESRLGRSGAEGVLTRLAELMFIEVLRRYIDELPPRQTGWLAGLRDESVGRVLALLHSRPGHPWTLADLAREAASSRSSLAKRFGEIMGQPPMQYLTQWRMQVAANLLAQTGAKVATIGSEVGYDSEAAFSRAFKKATGFAPGAWREARRTTRS